MKKMPRGEPQAAFKDFVTCYLITHKQPERFHQIHRAEAALPQRSVALQAMSEAQFIDFLRYDAPALRDKYLGFKENGYTGCYSVSEEAAARLNRIKTYCAEVLPAAAGEHHYNGVAIDGRYYVVDFTVDQFLAYPEIVQRSCRAGSPQPGIHRASSPPTYAGVLVLPCYRL
jgi:hypothetical protein